MFQPNRRFGVKRIRSPKSSDRINITALISKKLVFSQLGVHKIDFVEFQNFWIVTIGSPLESNRVINEIGFVGIQNYQISTIGSPFESNRVEI